VPVERGFWCSFRKKKWNGRGSVSGVLYGGMEDETCSKRQRMGGRAEGGLNFRPLSLWV